MPGQSGLADALAEVGGAIRALRAPTGAPPKQGIGRGDHVSRHSRQSRLPDTPDNPETPPMGDGHSPTAARRPRAAPVHLSA